jgi:ABC-2 type transport system ATP-binding protein
MALNVEVSGLDFSVANRTDPILTGVTGRFEPGQFVAILGENGSGKTTLLDLLMGFKKPSAGKILIGGEEPHLDNWQQRERIAYLSEKVDMPADWSARDFLNFNRYFYKDYSQELEQKLLGEFKVSEDQRIGNMSAGQIRRAQIVGALAAKPELIIVDEITAVLDIIGRRKFMRHMTEINKSTGCIILLATNILEDLENHVSHVILLNNGSLKSYESLQDLLGTKPKHVFSEIVSDRLEAV